MEIQNEKCVIIIDETLPIGSIANTAAILGITLGIKKPEIVGKDIFDANQNAHSGIIQFPVPILKGSRKFLKALRQALYQDDFSDLITADFTTLAQGCKTYDEFIDIMKVTDDKKLEYIGIAVCGNKKKINKLTGNLPLLR